MNSSLFNHIKEHKQFWALSFLMLILRLVLAGATELGNDEVYYTLYARNLSLSYFDHPPFVGWFIWLTTLGQLFTSELFVRLSAVLFLFGGAFLLYSFLNKLFNKESAMWGIVMFYSSVYFSIISGVFMMPDAPLVFFSILTLWLVWPVLNVKEPSKREQTRLVLAGFSIGFAFLSKYSGLYLWGGIGMFILLRNRIWLKKTALYLSALASAVCLLPVVLWNVQHDFISFTFHGNRVNQWQGIDWGSLIQFFGGQILYQNPLVVALLVIALIRISLFPKENRAIKSLLFWMSIPTFLLFLLFSTFRETLPHWTGPSFIFFIVFAAPIISQMKLKWLGTSALALVMVIKVFGFTEINYGWPLNFNQNTNIESRSFGKNDFTLDMYGWSQIGDMIQTQYNFSEEDKVLLVARKWYPAGHLGYYVAEPNGWDATVIGGANDMHEYMFLNEQLLSQNYDTMLFVTTSHFYFSPNYLKKEYIVDSVPNVFKTYRAGKPVNKVYIYGMARKE